MKYPERKNTKQKQQTNRKTEFKKKTLTITTTTTNDTLTHNHKQVILSSIFYTEDTIADDIYKKGLHPLPPCHHN